MRSVSENEEKQKMKQWSLFGGIVIKLIDTKFYCIYKNPDWEFEYLFDIITYPERR